MGKHACTDTGEGNGISLESLKLAPKTFKFLIVNLKEECPNLKKDEKSFISFDEVMKKIKK